MRFVKNESHKHRAIKFVKRFAFFPRKVQNIWIFLEHYYVRYEWRIVNETVFRENLGYITSIKFSKDCGERFDSWKYERETSFDKTTHDWVKSDGVYEKFPEDAEVSKWLIENSPLAQAMSENVE